MVSAPSVEVDCSVYPGFDEYLMPKYSYYVPAAKYRHAFVSAENEAEGTTATVEHWAPSTFLPPIVNAITDDRTYEVVDYPVFCQLRGLNDWVLPRTRVASSLDPIVETLIQPLPLWDNYSKGLKAIVPVDTDGLETFQFETCGVVQRASYHNRDCATALSALGRSDLISRIDQGFDAKRGTEVTLTVADGELRCSIFEEPSFRPVCEQGTCNANGLCTRHDAPPVVRFH